MKNFSKRAAASAVASIALAVPAAVADVPRVATDIGPVHSLAAQVMKGLGEPDLVMQAGASPHGYSMRPSEALALERADAVFWIGGELTPWLEGALDELASDAHVVALLDAEGTQRLEFREGATFEAHAHDDEGHEEHGEEHHDEHGGHDDHDAHADHDDHDDHAEHNKHDDHEGHDDHAEHADHDHEGADPHAWLAPENAKVWLGLIAAELSELDPENAAQYAANAEAGRAAIDAASAEVTTALEPVRGAGFIVFHDAFQYFENSFGLAAAGAVSLGDASDPGPARIAEIQQTVKDLGVVCVFSEPQFNPGLVATVLDGSAARTVAIDPVGAAIDLGPEFYPQLLSGLGRGMAECLGG